MCFYTNACKMLLLFPFSGHVFLCPYSYLLGMKRLVVWLQAIWPQQQLLCEQCPAANQGQQHTSVREQLVWCVFKRLVAGKA